MIPVKTMQKYKCDFCKKRGIKSAIEKHERRCFRNPNRFCDTCKNTGKTIEIVPEYGTFTNDCPYCSRFDPQQKKEIEEREQGIVRDLDVPGISPDDVPF
jgi:uncharacterized CHY-type Zn-finger protein